MKRIYHKIKNKISSKYWLKFEAQKLEQFKNRHQGEDCFIIGNGPSLNKMDLTLLNDYHTFGLNKIYLIFNRMPVDLSYHVAVNPLVIKQSKEEIKKINCDSFLSYLPAIENHLKSDNIYYLGDSKPSKFFYKNIMQGIHQGYTVTYVAMQLAYYMGFKRVFLVGVDHNFTQSGNPNEKQKMSGEDPNHFDPNYFKGQNWQLADLENIEVFYLIAQHYFEKNNREIIDATINGKLKIFKKADFDDVLKIAKKK